MLLFLTHGGQLLPFEFLFCAHLFWMRIPYMVVRNTPIYHGSKNRLPWPLFSLFFLHFFSWKRCQKGAIFGPPIFGEVYAFLAFSYRLTTILPFGFFAKMVVHQYYGNALMKWYVKNIYSSIINNEKPSIIYFHIFIKKPKKTSFFEFLTHEVFFHFFVILS